MRSCDLSLSYSRGAAVCRRRDRRVAVPLFEMTREDLVECSRSPSPIWRLRRAVRRSDNGPLSGLPDVAFVPRSSVYEPIGSDGSHALPGPKVSTPPCHQRVADARSIERATQSRHPESADLCAASRPAAYGYPAGANSPSLMVFKSPLGHPQWWYITLSEHRLNTRTARLMPAASPLR